MTIALRAVMKRLRKASRGNAAAPPHQLSFTQSTGRTPSMLYLPDDAGNSSVGKPDRDKEKEKPLTGYVSMASPTPQWFPSVHPSFCIRIPILSPPPPPRRSYF